MSVQIRLVGNLGSVGLLIEGKLRLLGKPALRDKIVLV